MSTDANTELPPLIVAVTGAAGQICYSLLPFICQGQMFGPNQSVMLRLLEIPPAIPALQGVAMELSDCHFPLVHGIVTTDNPEIAFKDADVALLIGAFPRTAGMERKDLLRKNAFIFKSNAQVISALAKPNIKVLVVGNPANTNALIFKYFAPKIPAKNISAMTRLDQNRAAALLAEKLRLLPTQIHNVSVWGNHSKSQYPDITNALVSPAPFPHAHCSDLVLPEVNQERMYELLGGKEAVAADFIPRIQNRGAEIIAARKMSSALSAAYAVLQHMHDWVVGSDGEVVSMGVYSEEGMYGVGGGVFYSYPLICKDGEWRVVENWKIDEFGRKYLEETYKELLEEKQDALAIFEEHAENQ